MLGFSIATWKLAARDTFIWWTLQLREKNHPLVVDNLRFLIPPWIEFPDLGSHILAIVHRCLPLNWTERYNNTPVFTETFVKTPRHTGAVYKASGWIHVRATKGARPIRPKQAVRQALEGHLAPALANRLEANPRPVIRTPSPLHDGTSALKLSATSGPRYSCLRVDKFSNQVHKNNRKFFPPRGGSAHAREF